MRRSYNYDPVVPQSHPHEVLDREDQGKNLSHSDCSGKCGRKNTWQCKILLQSSDGNSGSFRNSGRWQQEIDAVSKQTISNQKILAALATGNRSLH